MQEVNKIYISGKITGEPNLNREKFEAAEWHVKKVLRGFPINPHKLPDDHNKSWCAYMRVCVGALTDCDSVVALDDWKRSRGAIREIIIAKWLGIPVVCIESGEPIRIGLWLKIKLLLNLI